MSEGPRCLPAALGDSGPCPRAHGVDQLSQATCARFRVPAGSTSCPGRLRPGSEGSWVDRLSWTTRALVRGPVGSPSCPGQSGPMLDVPCCRPTCPVTWAQVRGPEVWTSYPARLGIGFNCLQCRPPVPGDAGSAPKPAGSTSDPGRLGPWSEGLRVDQLSWGLGPVSVCPQDQQALLGSLRTRQRVRGVKPLSWATMACVSGPAVSNSCPMQLGLGLEGLRC